MSLKVGELFVDISARTAQFLSGLDEAQAKSVAFGAAAGIAMANVASRLLAMGEAATTAFPKMIEHTAELGETLSKSSEKTGIMVEELSKLQYAGRLADISDESLTAGLVKFQKTIFAASEGGKEASEAFALLGISVRDTHGQLKPTDELFKAVAERFSMLEDGAEKTGLTLKLFGRGGAELIPILNQGAAGLQRAGLEAGAMGRVMSTETAAAARKLNDELKAMNERWEGIKIGVGTYGMPALELFAQTALKALDNLKYLKNELMDTLAQVALAEAGIGANTPEFKSWLAPGATEAPSFAANPLGPRLPLPDLEGQETARRLAAISAARRSRTVQPIPSGLGSELGTFLNEPNPYFITNYALRLRAIEDEKIRLQKDSAARLEQSVLSGTAWNSPQGFNLKLLDAPNLAQREMTRSLADLDQQVKKIGEDYQRFGLIAGDVARDLTDSLSGLLFTGKGLGEVFSGLAEQIGKLVLQLLVMKPLTDWLTGAFSGQTKASGWLGAIGKGIVHGVLGFAEGGNPMPEYPALVGERGPELFIPHTAGTVIPNSRLGGSIVINAPIDARGAQQGVAEQLARVAPEIIRTAVIQAVSATREMQLRSA